MQISAVQSGVISALPALPAQFFDASGLLREACARPGGASRLVDMGRGGVAYSPLAYASSSYFPDDPLAAPAAEPAASLHPARAQSVLLAGVCRS